MSMQTLERAILAEAKTVLNNPKLKMKDIMEWSTGPVKAEDGEVIVELPGLGVNVAVAKSNDLRQAQPKKRGKGAK